MLFNNKDKYKKNSDQKLLFSAFVFLQALILSSFAFSAQNDRQERKIIISAVISSSAESENPGINSLFLEILKLELSLEGMSLSDEVYPDVLIRGNYNIIGDSIQFSLDADLTSDNKSLYSITSQEELQFDLDKILLNHARKLTAAVVNYRDQNRDIYSITDLTDTPKITEEKIQENGILKDPVTPVEQLFIQDKGSLIYSADFGLFFAAGDAGRYFKTGYWPSFYAGYVIEPWLSAGLSAGVMYFQAEGYATTAQGLVFTAGPSVRIRAVNSSRFIPGVKFNASGAFFKVTQESGEVVNKLIPSIEPGMTVDIVTKKMILQASFDITVFFDSGSIVYGFTPRIGILF